MEGVFFMIETVGDLIKELEKYSSDARVYHSSLYALNTPVVIEMEGRVVIDIDTAIKELQKYE